MCELYGSNSDIPLPCSLSLSLLSQQGEGNYDGWGLARFSDGVFQVIKEACSAKDSPLADFLSSYHSFRTRVFLAHVRRASQGDLSLKNTHPFVRLYRNREIIFAHNGTVRDAAQIMNEDDLLHRPLGTTDSEYMFCAFLSILEREEEDLLLKFKDLESILRQFNRAGTMNLLFSDGVRFYCYKDEGGYNGFWAAERFIHANAASPEVAKGIVVSTKPLPGDDWKELAAGKLHVFSEGERVYGEDKPLA